MKPLSRFLSPIFLSLMMIGLSACVTTGYGTKVARDDTLFIQDGQTTRSEVEAKLGSPDMHQLLPDGRVMVMYTYHGTTGPAVFLVAAKATSEQTSLQLFYNEKGVVERHDYNGSSTNSVQTAWGGNFAAKQKSE